MMFSLITIVPVAGIRVRQLLVVSRVVSSSSGFVVEYSALFFSVLSKTPFITSGNGNGKTVRFSVYQH